MITGDHVVTAEAIGKEIGLFGKAISGEDLDKINLDKEIDNISIFARVSPHHKMKIVDALQRKGNVVAMTGDGVNDAPALKKADLGIAMGIAGTDVAKEASDMILMDDNFTSIVNAIEQGRGVYDNIKRFVCYMLSCNFAEVAILFVAIFMMFNVNGNMVLPLTALQILWMNLVTDSLPALALGVDPVSKDVMERKPRKKNARIISNRVILNIVIVCTLMTVSTLLLFSWCLGKYGLAVAQTASLTLLVLEQVAVAQMVRQENNLGIMSNKWLIAALAFVILLQIILVYHISFIEAIFGVTIANPFDIAPLSLDIWAIMVGISIIVYSIVIWLTKVLNRFFVE
jgi:Ca2+-transporting ATPase